MLGALTHGVSAVKGTEEMRTKHNILSSSSPITPRQGSEFCKKTHSNYGLHPPDVSISSPLLGAPPSGSSAQLRLGPTAVGSTSGETELLTPGGLAARHRHTDGPPPRHCIISGTSHVTRIDGRVAFMRFRWNLPKKKKKKRDCSPSITTRASSIKWTGAEIQSGSFPNNCMVMWLFGCMCD